MRLPTLGALRDRPGELILILVAGNRIPTTMTKKNNTNLDGRPSRVPRGVEAL